jgi:hypothetical protein
VFLTVIFIVTLNNVTSRAYGRVITCAMHASLPLNCNTTVGKTKARKVELSVRHISDYQKPLEELVSLCEVINRVLVRSVKIQLSLYRLLGVQEVGAPRSSRQLAHEGVKVVSPTHWPPLPTREYS